MELDIGRDRAVAGLFWSQRFNYASRVLVDATSGTVLLTTDDVAWLRSRVQIDRELVLAGPDWAEVEYRIRSFEDGVEIAVPPVCPDSIFNLAVRVVDALVAHCSEQDEPQLTVVPWQDPEAAHTIDVDLGPARPDHWLEVRAFPTATVVMWYGGEPLAGLR